MKRKRAARKKAVAKRPIPSVNVDEQAFINFVAQSAQENTVAYEINDANQPNRIIPGKDQFNAGMDPFSAGKDQLTTGEDVRSSSLSSSSSDNDESFHVELDSNGSDDAATFSRKRPSVNKQGLQKKGKASMQTFSAPVMPPRGLASNVMSSRGPGSKGTLPSKVLSSSSKKELPFVKKPSEDPRYNKLELKASLAVIKKVMEMDEAGPFNTPVDPVSQGIPDYFNIIDTPMDFGTICSNLQNGVKYMNSDDVYKDVNYIWENCSKYNKKGDYIVYLMKRVKKKFMKYWMSAGLRAEIPRDDNGPSLSMPSSDFDMWQSRHETLSAVNRTVTNSNLMQRDKFVTCEPQSQVFRSPFQSRHPQPSTTQAPPFPQLHTGLGNSYTDMTRGRAHDVGDGQRLGRDTGGKTTLPTCVRGEASMFDRAGPSAPSCLTPSSSQTTQGTHAPQPSVLSPPLPAISKLIQQIVPPELSPEPAVAEDEVGDSVPGGRIEITVIGDVMLPSEKCSRTIRKIFEKKLHIDGAKWKTVPQEMKEYYFKEFKRHYFWDQSIDHVVRYVWSKKAAARYKDLLSDIRNKGVRPAFLSKEVYKKWSELWSNPAYIRMARQNALNRRKGDENGVAPPCHTGGSVIHLEHRKRLAEQLGRDPTPHELFVYTHTRQHDGKTFVHEKAREVNERVESIKEQMTQNSSTVDESQVFFKAAGGKVKSKVYGLGSEGQDYYKYQTSKSWTYTSKSQSAELQQQLQELQKQQQSTEERHEERYNVLLETIQKQTEIIHAMKQQIESTAQSALAEVPPIMAAKKTLKSKAKARARK